MIDPEAQQAHIIREFHGLTADAEGLLNNPRPVGSILSRMDALMVVMDAYRIALEEVVVPFPRGDAAT